jgi:hypothetical protein
MAAKSINGYAFYALLQYPLAPAERAARLNKQPESPQDGKMSKKIPDFTNSQIRTVDSSLAERFKKKIEVQSIDSEIRLHPMIEEYDEIEDCIISLLRVQADHARETQQESESAS